MIEEAAAVGGSRPQAVLADAEPLTELLRTFLQTCDAMMGAMDGAMYADTQHHSTSDRHQTQSLFVTPQSDMTVASQSDQPVNDARARSGGARQLLSDGLLTLYFTALRWQRSLQWTSAEHYRHVVTVESSGSDRGSTRSNHKVTINKRCIDSSQYSAQIMAEHRAVVRFSGTVSPLDLYQRLHGQLKDTNAEQEVTSVALGPKHRLARSKSKYSRSQTLIRSTINA